MSLLASLVVTKDSPHRVLDCDRGFEVLLGYRPDEVVGRSIKFLFGPETDINKIRAAVKSASFREPYRMDVDIYGRSGNSQQVIVSCLQCQDSSDRCRISVETYNQEASPEKQTKRLEETKPFTHQVLDRVCIAQHIQPFGHTKKFRCFRPQSTITYIPFCDDFGPMNMACVSQFVILLDAELVHDVGAGMRIGGRGQRQHATRAQPLRETGDLEVLGTEVMAPLTDAVRLVDRQERDPASRQRLKESFSR